MCRARPQSDSSRPLHRRAVECIESLGADSGAVLAAADLPADLFEHPDTSVTLTELGALLEEVQRVTGREDLGFEVGRRIEVEAHGALGQTLQRCTTIDHALRLPELRLVFDSAYLDTPIATASPKLVALWENRCKSLLDHTQQEQPWSEWVSLMLNEAEDCQPTLDQLAALLSMGPHTLSRHLRREHQSFRELSNRVRYERACRLLRECRIPVSQIAYRLGYQGVSAFSDAFRRVSGQGPRAYRDAHREPA